MPRLRSKPQYWPRYRLQPRNIVLGLDIRPRQHIDLDPEAEVKAKFLAMRLDDAKVLDSRPRPKDRDQKVDTNIRGQGQNFGLVWPRGQTS